MTKRQLKELSGYVSTSTQILRVVFLIILLVVFSRLAYVVTGFLLKPFSPTIHKPAWIVLTSLIGVGLLVFSKKGSGGRAWKANVKADIERKQIAVHTIEVIDGFVFPEQEDEGPTILVKAREGECLMFKGQDLARIHSRGFPWKMFEIRESPRAKVFFGITKRGEPFPALLKRDGFTWDDYKKLAAGRKNWTRIESAEYDHLKNETT